MPVYVDIYNITLYMFLMGKDHSNPYIHSTTVVCDMYMYSIERSVNISITRNTRVKTNAFVKLLF